MMVYLGSNTVKVSGYRIKNNPVPRKNIAINNLIIKTNLLENFTTNRQVI